jgi:4-carboxymuconolactone decarboxylase
MDKKIEVMVALGAAIGVNCIPCFDHLYSKAKEIHMDDEEIKEIVKIASKVKNGASMFLNQAITDVVGGISEPEQSCSGSLKSSCN